MVNNSLTTNHGGNNVDPAQVKGGMVNTGRSV